MKRRAVSGFILAGVLLAALVVVVGGREVIDQITAADRRMLWLGVLSGTLALTFRGLVWGRFVTLVDDAISRGRVVTIFLTAMFLKYVTPYGQVATEPLVAHLVARDGEMAFEDGLASVLSADFVNYVPYYTFGFIALGLVVFDGTLGSGMLSRLLAFCGLFGVLLSTVYVVTRRPEVVYGITLAGSKPIRRLTGVFTDRFDDRLEPRVIRSRLDGFYGTLDAISGDRRTLAVGTVYAHCGMLFLMLPVYLGGVALGYRIALPVVALVVALGKLGSVLPSPGGTGGVEAIVAASLVAFAGMTEAPALTVAFIYRLSTYWLTIAIGGVAASGLTIDRP
ncbi:YbhN family protein [Natrarchaeobius sp. A-rgal3]|uniref:lysylphosphatidylglycerol synthase transmembrane domain-containing protein n=1 Tax=Natrarchaeobius versutus TaxID=1679078 RepID=UPI00350F3AA6